MKNSIGRIAILLLTVGLIYVCGNSWDTIPALGKLITPFHGYLQQVKGEEKARVGEFKFTGLSGEVLVKYDDRAVPHIFAENDRDLYFAQGFVVAKDRLWQMDFYTLAAAGRLSEVVGPAALELDRYHRRIGLAKTAEEIIDYINKSDSLSLSILEAYAEGVNAYISTLAPRDFPVEYKILGYSPEEWSPLKSILMLMNMRHDLSAGTDDFRMSNVLAQYGDEMTRNLFPDYPSIESPIIPSGTVWDFEPLGTPPVPKDSRAFADTDFVVPRGQEMSGPNPEIGSNNWAVRGTKTASGLPLLSNDPHLRLTLPSIWYQIQLHAPGVNVYGVALPGTPAVIIGFNKDIAWGVTNVGSDVLDFYKVRFKDESKQEYWHNGVWKPVDIRIEVFKQKGLPDLIDTVYFTHHGPVVYHEKNAGNRVDFPEGHAMRWVANESQCSDLLTFHYLNRAKNYTDYREALLKFTAPAQNFVFASNENDISITSNGKLPLKWEEQGKFVLDGTLASHDWQGWIPLTHNPTVKNPTRNFVSSANQFPTDRNYPYYLGWEFAPSSRALRINQQLDLMENATMESFRLLLHDNFNMDAQRVLPQLLETLAKNDSIRNLPEFQIINDWKYNNDAEEVAASIFEYWMPILRNAIWNDNFDLGVPSRIPSLARTYDLILNEPNSSWFDDIRTEDYIEDKFDVVSASFLKTLETLREKKGDNKNNNWQWASVKNTSIAHLVPNFVSFGRHDVWNGGGARIVNATSEGHGPSWRMIVQLDKQWPQALGIFPGGQSGNPGSPYYDNMIDKWAAGEMDTLLFLRNKEDGQDQVRSTITLTLKK